eukprot:244820-Rhodomonas_salina.1
MVLRRAAPVRSVARPSSSDRQPEHRSTLCYLTAQMLLSEYHSAPLPRKSKTAWQPHLLNCDPKCSEKVVANVAFELAPAVSRCALHSNSGRY